MPVLLAEADKNILTDLQMGVIDEFVKGNWLMEHLPFDDVVSPVGGGSGWEYSYTRLDTQPEAEFRAVNTEYSEHEVTKERYTATMAIMGGSYAIDRVIADRGGIVKETWLQATQKIKAANTLFNQTVINGSVAVDPLAFDGLEVMLAGTSQDYDAAGGAGIDLSSAAMVDTNWQLFQDELDYFIDLLDGTPTALFVNKLTKQRILACARRAGRYSQTITNWGRRVDNYDGIPIVDLGDEMASTDPIVKIDANGESPIYAVRIGLDAFHGLCTLEGLPIKTWLPDYTNPKAVQIGSVELIAGVAMKRTKAGAVMRKIKVAA